MKKFRIAAVAALVLFWGWAFAADYIEVFEAEELEWERDFDNYDVGTDVQVDDNPNPLKATLKLGKEFYDEEDEDNSIWPYLSLSAYLDADISQMTKVDIEYSTNKSGVRFGFLTEHKYDGEQVVYSAGLSNGNNKSSSFELNQFVVVGWAVDSDNESPYNGPEDLSRVEKNMIEPTIVFYHEVDNTSIDIEVTSIKIYGANWTEENGEDAIKNPRHAVKSANFAITGISAGRLGLRVPSAGNYSVAIYGVNGKMLAQTKANLVQGLNTLAISKNLARGVAIVRVQGANATLVKKISIK
jgi:hypothetical protein